IENKLAAARRFFNNSTAEYNTAREQFPASMLSGMFGFAPREFFNVGEEGRAALNEAPQVKFS
ncbi:MAG: LemA family protein, partial [Pseudomonadota bacterium]